MINYPESIFNGGGRCHLDIDNSIVVLFCLGKISGDNWARQTDKGESAGYILTSSDDTPELK